MMADVRIDSLERGEPLVPSPSPPPANFAALTSQAERGDAQAQTDLGNIYLDSHSVLNDYTKGISWLRKAADQNFLPAENALSNAYCVGYGGTPKDGPECRQDGCRRPPIRETRKPSTRWGSHTSTRYGDLKRIMPEACDGFSAQQIKAT